MTTKNVNNQDKKVQLNKQTEYRLALENFLRKHKVEGQGVFHTHTAFGPPYGKFNIPEDSMDDFFELYGNVMQTGCDLHIVERPKKVGPLLIDIDYHLAYKHDERLYKDSNIKYVIGCINSVIRKYYKWSGDVMTSFVFEKDKPSETDKKEWKDGFHIVYPYIAISEGMRFLIVDSIKKMVIEKDGFKNIPYINSIDDVFDTSVIKANGWMMYGSRKMNGQHYKLKKVYTCTYDEIDIKTYKHRDLVKLLSNRKFGDDEETEFKNDINKDELDEEVTNILIKYNVIKTDNKTKKDDKTKKDNKTNNNNNNSNSNNNIEFDDDFDEMGDDEEYEDGDEDGEEDDEDGNERNDIASIRSDIINNRKEQNKKRDQKNKSNESDMAVKLVQIMSNKRANEYDSWIKVGWALHNVNSKLLNAFKEFSKKAGNSYNEQSCETVWRTARDSGLGIASLRHWAKLDNTDAYDELLTENINELIVEAESGTEYDVAKVVHELYKDQYVCTSINHNTWYEFQTHRWIEVEGGYTLSKKISEELTREFAILSTTYLRQMSSKNKKGSDRDSMLTKANNVMKIMNNLKKSGFKERVIKESKNMFYSKEFEEKIDSNRNLIGFNNGVFDLVAGIFRDGSPDDLVSRTVGYDYEEYAENHEYVVGIKDFFCKIQTEEDMREYILTLLSSYLDGHTTTEQFVIWTGSGGNGKSKCVEFFQLAFGEYCGVLPVTVLTRKRGGSGQATPELAEMRGKRFVVFQEPENTDEIQIGFMKELTGGDWIYARPLFKDPIRYKPQFKLLLTCNKLPTIPSNDGGTWRRLRVSPWPSEFVDRPRFPNQFKKDPKLGEKMELWKKAFLWFLMKIYYPIYKEFGLREPAKVLEFTNNYKKNSDIYLEFIDAQLELTQNEGHFESLDILYASLKNWYGESHSGKCPHQRKDLVDYLSNNKYKIDKRNMYCVRFRSDQTNEGDALDA